MSCIRQGIFPNKLVERVTGHPSKKPKLASKLLVGHIFKDVFTRQQVKISSNPKDYNEKSC